MLIQIAGYKQIGIQYRAMLFQIPFPQPSIFPKRGLLSIAYHQIRDEIVSNVCNGVLIQTRFSGVHGLLQYEKETVSRIPQQKEKEWLNVSLGRDRHLRVSQPGRFFS